MVSMAQAALRPDATSGRGLRPAQRARVVNQLDELSRGRGRLRLARMRVLP
jgi:hypothetical protein